MSLLLSLTPSSLLKPTSYNIKLFVIKPTISGRRNGVYFPVKCCSNTANDNYNTDSNTSTTMVVGPPVMKKRKRYRKYYPGEKIGITEEMRFVAMRLRNVNGKFTHNNKRSIDGGGDEKGDRDEDGDGDEEKGEGERWMGSMEGFMKYLVDSKVVFGTIERIVDHSEDVSYAYFRRTGLERSEGISKDLECLAQREDVVIPEPGNPGISYSKYLEELAEKSAPLFLSHLYNIYFSHIAGGQVIAKKVSEELLEGRELEFYKWNGDVQQMLKNVRDKLNTLGEHWTRDEKNKCLKEATKSFRYMGQIIRLIIL